MLQLLNGYEAGISPIKRTYSLGFHLLFPSGAHVLSPVRLVSVGEEMGEGDRIAIFAPEMSDTGEQ